MKPSNSAKAFKVTVTKDNKGGGAVVPPGIYKARVGMEASETKDKSKAMAKITYTLMGTDKDGKNVANRKAFDNLTFEESMLWKWNDIFKALTGDELPEESFTFEEMFALLKNAGEGRTVSIELITEVYNEKENNKVKKIFA